MNESQNIGKFFYNNLGMDFFHTAMQYKTNDLIELKELELQLLTHITCSKCGRCCIEEDVQLLDDDIEELCKYLNISFDDFYEEYMNKEHIENYLLRPCPFYVDESCSIYESRPDVCRTFPFCDEVLTLRPCELGENIYSLMKITNKTKMSESDAALEQQRFDLRNNMMDTIKDPGDCFDCTLTESCFVNTNDVKAVIKELNKRENRRI